MGSWQLLLSREQEKEGISVRLWGGLSSGEVGALELEWVGGCSFFPKKQAAEGPWLLEGQGVGVGVGVEGWEENRMRKSRHNDITPESW